MKRIRRNLLQDHLHNRIRVINNYRWKIILWIVIELYSSIPELAEDMNLEKENSQLQELIFTWIQETCDREMKEMMQWQLLSTPKYFRPITIFSCCRAVTNLPLTDQVLRAAVALE